MWEAIATPRWSYGARREPEEVNAIILKFLKDIGY